MMVDLATMEDQNLGIRLFSIDYFLKNEHQCINYIKDHIDEIPYLNIMNINKVKNNSLVRFRGMVQDINPLEVYTDKYEVINSDTGDIRFECGRYKEFPVCQDNETINMKSQHHVYSQRKPCAVISIPGLNKWVTDIERNKYGHIETATEMNELNGNESHLNDDAPELLPPEYVPYLPFPDKECKVCIIKAYNDNSRIKMNRILDFVGFISLENPEMKQRHESLYEPHSSLLPKLHAVYWNRVHFVNPLVTINTNIHVDRAAMLTNELKMIFTEVLFGDSLAGSYLFYYLMSTIYLRSNSAKAGKFTLNFSHIPEPLVKEVGTKLHEVIQMLVPHSCYLPISTNNMNQQRFVPTRERVDDMLQSGVLQLPNNTHLVLDETELCYAELQTEGLKALNDLQHLIKTQGVSYNFKEFAIRFEHKPSILIISEKESILKPDYHVILKPNDIYVSTYDEVFPAAKLLLMQELLNDFRQYLTVLKSKKYNGSFEMDNLVGEYSKLSTYYKINVNNLHQLIDMSRLVALGDGLTDVDKNSWNKACKLEQERWQRLGLLTRPLNL